VNNYVILHENEMRIHIV